MLDSKKYEIKIPDWREGLRVNRRKTAMVVLLFIFIYLLIGFVGDLYLYMDSLRSYNQPAPPIGETAKEIATFQLFPIASLVMLGVALISLLIAYLYHQKLVMLGTEYHEITSDTTENEERKLYNVVEELKIASGLRYMPKVFIIEADYMNAFASGFTEKSALVAITRGLLEKLDRDELQAVMAHEISHIRHNDIRLTLTVLVLSNILLIAIDTLFRGVIYSNDSKKSNVLVIVILILRFLLPIITILLMLYLSRTREYMADSGSVELTRNNEPLARALIKIHKNTTQHVEKYSAEYTQTPNEDMRQAAYFYDPSYANIKPVFSLNNLFSSHPSLEDRLHALGIEVKSKEY